MPVANRLGIGQIALDRHWRHRRWEAIDKVVLDHRVGNDRRAFVIIENDYLLGGRVAFFGLAQLGLVSQYNVEQIGALLLRAAMQAQAAGEQERRRRRAEPDSAR